MIKVFKNIEYGSVRTTLIDNEPCFCLKDICKMLDISNITDCRNRLNESGIRMVRVPQDKSKELKNMIFITSDNLSGCVFQSKKAEAEVICDWLYRIVLPQLKNYGHYNVDDFQDPEYVVKFLEEYEDLKIKNNVMETTIKINSPKIKSFNKLLGTNNCYDLDIVYEVINYRELKRSDIFKILRINNVIDHSNIPLQEYCDKKYFRVVEAQATCGSSTIISKRTYVYQSGLTFIEKLINEYQGQKEIIKSKK